MCVHIYLKWNIEQFSMNEFTNSIIYFSNVLTFCICINLTLFTIYLTWFNIMCTYIYISNKILNSFQRTNLQIQLFIFQMYSLFASVSIWHYLPFICLIFIWHDLTLCVRTYISQIKYWNFLHPYQCDSKNETKLEKRHVDEV